MIRIDSLGLTVGEFSLSDIDLQIGAGECHALLGPSGSGKSTLVSALLGLKKPDAGTIRLEGRSITELTIEERGFGYLPQNLALFPHLTVEENLRYGIRARKIGSPEIENHLQELIDITDIRPLLKRMPSTLSGGERQRVALVRALAPRPKLLLLDEPFSALDSSLRRELWTLVRRLQTEYGTTMLLITHDLSEAYFLASQISVIINGEIRQSGTREEVFYHPADIQVAKYLGIRNIFQAKVIKVNEKHVTCRVPELNCELQALLPRGRTAHVNERITLAIRPEHFKLTRRDDNSVNLLYGTFERIPMGGSTLLYFTPSEGKKSLEILVQGVPKILEKGNCGVLVPEERIIFLGER